MYQAELRQAAYSEWTAQSSWKNFSKLNITCLEDREQENVLEVWLKGICNETVRTPAT